MIDALLASIAPHYCCGCGQIGSILCDCCKNSILDEPFARCILCLNVVKDSNLCSSHGLPYQKAWAVDWREGVLAKLIDEYKFNGRRESAKYIAQLIDLTLPELPENTIIVPVPTTAKNIRLRGYDHIRLVAKRLAKDRGWGLSSALARQNNITQHLAGSASLRRRQADSFFRSTRQLDEDIPYLLIDDIYTTGSTIEAAAKCLQAAGAKNIFVAIVARQKPKSA